MTPSLAHPGLATRPGRLGRSAGWAIPLAVVTLVFAGLGLAACTKRSEANLAAAEVKVAAQQVHAATQRLVTEYPRIETELDPLRAAQPARAAARIRAEIVPLLDDVARGLITAAKAEERYVAVAIGDHGAIERIRDNAALHRRQAAAYAEVRDGYLQEASFLDAGPVPPAEARALVAARIATLQAMN